MKVITTYQHNGLLCSKDYNWKKDVIRMEIFSWPQLPDCWDWKNYEVSQIVKAETRYPEPYSNSQHL